MMIMGAGVGLVGSGTPVDGSDACCRIHDHCYDKILKMKLAIRILTITSSRMANVVRTTFFFM